MGCLDTALANLLNRRWREGLLGPFWLPDLRLQDSLDLCPLGGFEGCFGLMAWDADELKIIGAEVF